MMEPTDDFTRYRQRYLDGDLPWDDPSPPPEIIEQVATLPPGRGLDLGCGYGRTCIYLALHGWAAYGVDYIPEAIDVAKVRAADAGVGDKVHFYVASATAMPFLDPGFDLAVDIGCLHSFDEPARVAYCQELQRLLRSGGHYLLFARLTDESDAEAEAPSGLAEQTIRDLFAADFTLLRFERGVSVMSEDNSWASGWFWFRRR